MEYDQTGALFCKRVSELRKEKQLTLDQLARTSGVSRSMLSQIERGQANPTLAVTFRIAQAFGITVGELVDQPEPNIEVLRGDDENNLFRNDKTCTIRTLSPLHVEKSVEFYEIKLAPGATLNSGAHFEGTKEILSISQGQAEITSDDSIKKLAKNDSAFYRADIDHSIHNNGKELLICYLVVRYK